MMGYISQYVLFIMLSHELLSSRAVQIGSGIITAESCYNGKFQANQPLEECDVIFQSETGSYSPPPGDGWILLTLPAVAMVTHVELILRNPSSVIMSAEITLSVDAKQARIDYSRLTQGTFCQPFSMDKPVITNSITVFWRSNQLPDIVDIRIHNAGPSGDVLRPASTSCDNHQQGPCGYTTDRQLITTMYLATDTHLTLTLPLPQTYLTHVALYSHQTKPVTTDISITISLYSNTSLLEQEVIIYQNHGWRDPSQWQLVALRRPYHAPHRVVIGIHHGGTYAVVSEVQLHRFTTEPVGSVPGLPALDKTYGSGHVPVLRAVVVETADVGTTAVPVVSPTYTHTPRPSKEALIEFTTGRAIGNDEDLEDDDEDLEDDDDVITYDAGRTTTSMVPTTSTIYTRTHLQGSVPVSEPIGITEESATTVVSWLPFWFWYLMLGVAVLVVVLVFVLVLVICRLRRRSYDTTPPHPNVIIRSQSTTSQALSVVTPTRGFFHWALDSQSSLPLPYSGVSATNTTTFTYADQNGQEYTECNENNQRISDTMKQTSRSSQEFDTSDEWS